MADIDRVLTELGLEQYGSVLAANDVDLAALPLLQEADLKELGMTLGHRRKLMGWIGAAAATAADTERRQHGRRDAEASAMAHARTAPGRSERRHLTVLFIDIVGSTALGAALDPEEMRGILLRFQDLCAGAIARYDGFLARFLGDGVLAYFGYPRAHEDAAERAVRVALQIRDAAHAIRTPGDAPLALRIGISSGLVVIDEITDAGTGRDQRVTGDTPNLAARLQQEIAAAGEIVISPATRRLLGGRFETEDLGQCSLKGFATRINVWRVVGENPAESRFDAAHRGSLSQIVGRDHEVALLLDRWHQAEAGEGQVVILVGEAGIGKSRIIDALRDGLDKIRHVHVGYQCAPFYASSALQPAIGHLERAADFGPHDHPDTKLDKLERLIRQTGPDNASVMPLFAALLSLPTEARYPPLTISPEQQKQRTLEAIVEQFVRLSRQQPVLFVVEDTHWIDPTTLELLGLCVERIQHMNALMVVSCRPDFVHPWGGLAHVTSLTLNRLGHRHCSAIVEQVTEGRKMAEPVFEHIIAKTDGVPLFVEELTKTILESGVLRIVGDSYMLDGPLPQLSLPATLQDSLMARLDRLGEVKEVAQVAAVIGRDFSYDLLAAIEMNLTVSLDEALGQLVTSGLVYRRGGAAHPTYFFKHALVQDAAYSSLLLSGRQQLHGQIADKIAEHFPDVAEVQPEILAHHNTEAKRPALAIDYWLKAGKRASERSANIEAIAHLERGVALLDRLPEGHDRERRELMLQASLGMPLIATRGYSAAETGAAWARTRALAEALGETAPLLRSLYGLWAYNLVGGDIRVGREMAGRFLALAEAEGDKEASLVGHRILGVSLHGLGMQEQARAEIERALDLYDPMVHRPLAYIFGQDQRVAGLSFLAVILWVQGFPDRAKRTAQEAVTLARDLDHANSFGYALAFGGCPVAELCGAVPLAERLASTLLAYSEENDAALWRAFGLAHKAWVDLAGDDALGALHAFEDAIAAFRAAHARLRLPLHLGDLARAQGRVGRIAEGLATIREARSLVEQGGERWVLPELLRIEAELSLAAGGEASATEAYQLLQEALGLAREHGARSWELRIAISLARLWRDMRRIDDARALLARSYGWFVEGFDTADLKAARALLGELGA
jgi:class 3 adenylate cyclase/predicted ATPase